MDAIVNPANDPQARGDPFRTLFVARLSYDVKDADLERHFGGFGPIERVRCRPSHPHNACWSLTLPQIRIVKDTVSPKAGKKPHKGYAFIVYEREKDMKGIAARFIPLPSWHASLPSRGKKNEC